jgi:polar amino acid transport system substrate-binding protein
MMKNLRDCAKLLALAILCALAAGCAAAPAEPAPPQVVEKIVTQVVEKEKQVEKVVEAPAAAAPAAAAPAAAAPAAAAPAPPSAAASWDAIRQSGELKAGVSAGASPYAFYRPDLTLDGFDVALAGEIARRLGLELVLRDLPPDALSAALQAGQIDLALGPLDAVAAGAISGPYYIARDAVLARPGSTAVRTAADLANLKLGAVRGSDYAAWAADHLDAGRIVAYATAPEAADALARGEVDALLLDYRPALRLAGERGLTVAGEGLAPRQEAVTVLPESEILRSAVDGALAGAVTDGAIARLAARYFGLTAQDILPLPIPAATPTPRPPGYFSADRPRITPGECVAVSWHVENVNAVFFSEAGETWEKHPATGQEMRQVCPARTTTYALHVVHYDGREEARSLTVAVSSTPEPPADIMFEVQPVRVAAGDCVEVRWDAPLDVVRVRIARDGVTLWDDAAPSGVLSDCPPATGVALYRIEADYGDGVLVAERPVEVQ